MSQPLYKRVLLKVSGEMLSPHGEKGFDFDRVDALAAAIKEVHDLGVQIGIVCGAGNIWRARDAEGSDLKRTDSDYCGMLGTVINAMALKGKLEKHGLEAVVLSALDVHPVCESFNSSHARQYCDEGKIVLCGGGTRNPYFTTDSAAALRALELECDVLLKATKVDGVYDSDPEKNPDAKRFEKITFTEVLEKNLRVMDGAAISLCRDNGLPIRVFSLHDVANLKQAVTDESIGTDVVGE